MPRLLSLLCFFACSGGVVLMADEPQYSSQLVFPLNDQHNHAPGIVQLKNHDLLVSWYRGAGERKADDVVVYGARLSAGSQQWSEPFVMVDRPGFPDCNTCMYIDQEEKLWLFWPTILANTWESCLTNYAVSTDYAQTGAPRWQREAVILLKPDDFADQAEERLAKYLAKIKTPLSVSQQASFDAARAKLRDKLYQRLGWQPRCKPTVLPSGRILLPLYTDTFSFSLMAISDDGGKSWQASQPIMGFGAIQPTVLRRNDGTLIAYMRENGTSDRIRTSESQDDGATWSEVTETELPNPGSGLDGVRLSNGHWLLIYNDQTNGRNHLAVSISTDEGQTWKVKRHLEQQASGSYHYPAVIEGRDGLIHFVYSYFVEGGKSMKHVAVNEAWILAGDKAQ
ncbi:MAG: exo-alpha-sialidase [Pirellulaceae bacterium]|nr:exo-alpha-sialidase [Pirellulaceae bacterium]